MSCLGSPSSDSGPQIEHDGCTSPKWVLLATILGSSMEFIDGTVTSVALPAIQSSFHATAVQAVWVSAGYGLFLSSLLLLAGALGDRFGQRKIFGLGVFLFTLSSTWCAFAPSMTQLLIARAAQGASGACLVANSLAFLNSSTPIESRGKAIGTWSAVGALMAACGPILGGWLIQNATWRWVFLLNIPTGVAALWITAAKTKDSKVHPPVRSLDLPGAFLGTSSLASMTFGLLEWEATPRLGVISSVIGLFSAIAFVRWESTTRDPLLPLSLFSSRIFSGTNLVTLLLYGGVAPIFFYLPIRLIQILGYSPRQAGAALLPLVLTLSLFSRWSGSLTDRVGARTMLSTGPLLVAAGLFLLAFSGLAPSYWHRLAPALFLIGLGLAITVSPLTAAVMASVDDERAGIASGVNNTIAQVAALVVLALSTPIFQYRFDTSLRIHLATSAISSHDSSSMWAQRHRLGAMTTSNADERAIVGRAFVDGFALVGSIAGSLALFAAIAGATSLRATSREPESLEESLT